MKPIVTLLLALACSLALPARADEAAKELKLLQGNWNVLRAETAGKDRPEVRSPQHTVVIEGNMFRGRLEGHDKTIDWKLTLDPSARPRTVDLALGGRDALVAKGIYEFDGDELKICWSAVGDDRPKEFVTRAGDGRNMLTLRRPRAGRK